MLTHSYFQTTNDPALLWAQLNEWVLREQAYRLAHPDEVPEEKTLIEIFPPARDAGDVCGVCGELVTWVDHLPPERAGEAPRCRKNVYTLRGPGGVALRTDIVIDDIFPRV